MGAFAPFGVEISWRALQEEGKIGRQVARCLKRIAFEASAPRAAV